jgi:hypothetical protein
MEIDDAYQQWAEDAEVLAQIGRALYVQPTRIAVRLPKELADQALASWQRDNDEGMSLPDQESAAQSKARDDAATLSLIGLSIQDDGAVDGDEVTVDLDAWDIGQALQSADDAGLLRGLLTSEQRRAMTANKERSDDSAE